MSGSSRGRIWKGVRTGLRQRNPLVLMAGAALAVSIIVFLYLALTSGAWSKAPSWLVLRADRSDSANTYVAWTVGRLKADPPARPAVFLLGGSTAREATVEGGQSLARKIHRYGGPDIAGWNLASSLQTFAQDIAIVDNLPASPSTTVIIGISPGRFTSAVESGSTDSEAPTLLLWSNALRSFMERQWSVRDPADKPLSDAAKLVAGTVRSDLAECLSGRLPNVGYVQHKLDGKPMKTEGAKREVLTSWWRVRYPQFKSNVDANSIVLDELVRFCMARGFSVVLVELPRNLELIGDLWDGVDNTYQPRTRELAEKHGVPYIDFNDELALPSEAFFDYAHARSEGRERWENELARRLARLYQTGVLAGGGR